ncbi:MAG: transposase [Flavobacteriaceae bacterium]|nr:transposase [Flavobacteriaceae bacterium]
MSRNYVFKNPKGLYFVSFAVVNWLPVLTNKAYIPIILDCLSYSQKQKGMKIIAWCVMPNHIHLIFRSSNDIKPGNLLGDFKRFTSNKVVKAIIENPTEPNKNSWIAQFKMAAQKSSNVKHHQFWRHDNMPIELWSNKVIRIKINYIHQNPVKGGLVSQAEDYLYSSAKDYVGEKGLLDDILIMNL